MHRWSILDPPIMPILPPVNGVVQDIAPTWYDFHHEYRADPIYVTNIAGAYTGGAGPATSEVFQIAANTLNQFGAAGSAVTVLGDYSVSQLYRYGNNNNISVLNSNGAFSAGGFSTTAGSQIIATAINNTAVDNGKGGQNFEIAQVYAPDLQFPFGVGNQNITQQNSMTAGYDTNAPAVGTGGAAINGVELPNNTGTNHAGLQANSLTINTASVNLLAPVIPFVPYRSEDLKVFQTALLNTNIDLFNVADAGSQDPKYPPPNGGYPPIDPSITNLQQIAAVTINSLTLDGETLVVPGPFPDIPASFNLKAAFASTPFGQVQVPNQSFAGVNPPGPGGGADITLFNVAHALTWRSGAYTGPGVEWDPRKAGTGDVSIGDVKQIVALTINNVSGATSQDGNQANQVNVFAGTLETNLGSQTPYGLSSFWQSADLSELDLDGRPGGSFAGGAGIQNSFVDKVNTNLFPSYAGSQPVPVPPTGFPAFFDWDDAQNTAIAGTGVGNALIQNTDQVVAVTVNNFSFDNSLKDADGKIKTGYENTDVVKGAILQTATLSDRLGRPNDFTLMNVAEALTGKGTATLDAVTQTNVFSVNSFTAGVADFNGYYTDQAGNVLDTGRLVQRIDTNGAILNLGNLAIASGTVANVTDTKQINAVSLNTATIGTLSGGGISQTLNGGLNVNTGNYLQATGTLTASITNAQQISVVNVNSITGYAH